MTLGMVVRLQCPGGAAVGLQGRGTAGGSESDGIGDVTARLGARARVLAGPRGAAGVCRTQGAQ